MISHRIPLGLACVVLLSLIPLLSCTNDSNSKSSSIEWAADPVVPDPRPDIVLVVSDDMRWDLMSARGHEFLDTPNLDILSNEGAMMLNAFVPVAVCSQSRAAILTGRDVHKASAPVMVRKNNSFLQTQKTFASYLQEAGYTTAFLGKWHLGEGSQPKEGFDHWESFDWLGDFHDPVIYRNGEPIAHNGYVDDILSRRAHEVLYQNREPGKPMFVMVSLKAPHLRFEHPERHAHAMESDVVPKPDTYDEDYSVSGKPQGIYDWLGIEKHIGGIASFSDSWQKFIKYHFRAVLGLDDQVGVLRKAIRSGGKPDNTLFIFTSDNGYSLGDHGLSAKHFVYEEPIRVPFLIDAPGDSEAGLKPVELVSTLDIAPTILDYANWAIPPTMTGRSLRALLDKSTSDASWRDELFFMYEKERDSVPTQIALRTDRYKLIRSETDAVRYEFYDLKSDPKETLNLHDAPSYSVARDTMHARLNLKVEQNQWSTRSTFEVGAILASEPVATDDALRLARELSESPIDSASISQSIRGELDWQILNREVGNSLARFNLKNNIENTDGQSILVVLPLERLVGWDPFVQVVLNPRMHASIFTNGEFLYATRDKHLPGEVINPPLIDRLTQVVLVFDDTGDMDALIALRVSENAIKLPLEDRTLGASPGRFLAVDGWQPHRAVSIQAASGALDVQVSGADAVIQTESVYLNQMFRVEIDAISNTPLSAVLHWRSEQGEWSNSNSEGFDLNTTEGVSQAFEITSPEPIEALQIRFEAEVADVRIERIKILSTAGTSLYHWEFD